MKDDSWKGEHLIRALKRPEPVNGGARDWRRTPTVCAHEGCKNTLARGNRTGYCRQHFQKKLDRGYW